MGISSKLQLSQITQKPLEYPKNHHERSYLYHSFFDCHSHCYSLWRKMWPISWWLQPRLIFIENYCWHSCCYACPIYPFDCRKAAGLAPTLDGKGDFTVFAPTNDAFAKLGGKVSLLLQPMNKDMLSAILLRHVLPTRIMAGDIPRGTTK